MVDERAMISVVLVNWNGAAHLHACLPTLRRQSYEAIEIIVVDNGSSDNSHEIAAQNGARWLPLYRNMGLAPALNHGAAIARGKLLLFVNNDMWFDSNFAAHLAQAVEAVGGVFAADGLQYDWEGERIGHAVCRLSVRPPRGIPSVELVPGLHFYQESRIYQEAAFMASAASMLVRRTYFEALGGFDERLPLGYEDVEICWRAWLRGWRTVSVPAAVCWHRVGGSGGSREAARRNFEGVLKGKLVFASKLLPVRYGIATWMRLAAGFGKDLGQLRPKRAAERAATLIKIAREIPALLRERRAIFSSAMITPQKQLDRMLELTSEERHGIAAD